MRNLRILVIGGFTSYRALFNWISPWVIIPTFIVEPLAQMLLFAYVGRGARLADDAFFVLGNAVLTCTVPCLFGMTNTITGERQQQTLGLLLTAPVARVPLFLGRALPVIVNGVAVSLLALVLGAVLLGVPVPPHTWLPLVVTIVVSGFSCTGLGLVTAALALRVRETAVLTNVVIGGLIIVCGANVPVGALPGWAEALSTVVPLRHGVEATRIVAAGGGLGAALPQLGLEALVGVGCLAIGVVVLRVVERSSRRAATLEFS